MIRLVLTLSLCAAACGTSGGGPASGPASGPATAAATAGATAASGTPAAETLVPTASPVSPFATAGGPTESAGPPVSSTESAGVEWMPLDPGDGPAAREDHTWTVSGDGRSAYLFGGRSSDGDTYDDIWRYDLATNAWERLEPRGQGPVARFGHTATWVQGVGLVVWSGQAGADFFDDLWAFDPAAGAWSELPGRGDRPAARYGSCAVLSDDGRLWISHGFTFEGRFDDTRTYDFGAGSWSDVTPPGRKPVERCLHDCLWTDDGLLLYAGQTDGMPALRDAWRLGGDGAWTESPDAAPAARQLYAIAQAGATALVVGGSGTDGRRLDDAWLLDLGTLGWGRLRPVGDIPPGRSGATLVSDLDRGRFLLFGGRTAERTLSDVWSAVVQAGA